MEVDVFSGIQGSGKSSFYAQRFLHTHVRISLDLLKTRQREDILLHACLAAQTPFVVDAINPTAEKRARYVRLAKAAGFRAVLFYFEVSVKAAIARNAQRPAERRVPQLAILGTQAKLQPPSAEEGFDASYRLQLSDSGAFIVGDFTDT